MTIERWDIDPELKKEAEEHYKTKYSLTLASKDPLEIARLLTFDGLPKKITTEELVKFLERIDMLFLDGNGFRGVGLEIGSGPGTFVAAFANMQRVEKIYGVELCESIVETLMKKVASHIAGTNSHKIIGAVGTFNALAIPDNSVDFVFDFFSLHHSPEPTITLRELHRVLKKGGVVLCVDKARADSLTKSDLEALLDREYSSETKINMGLSPDTRHTRRMNGEYEYRLQDWNRHFMNAGFPLLQHYSVAKIGGYLPVRLLKHILAVLPVRAQSKLSSFFSKKVTNDLDPSNRIFTNIFPSYPREFSLLVALKQ